MNELVLPCYIGSTVYIVRDYNSFNDSCEKFITKYGTEVVVEEFIVEHFIYDKNGFNISIMTWDGYLKLKNYHHLTLDEYGDCKIFTTLEGAAKYLDNICD